MTFGVLFLRYFVLDGESVRSFDSKPFHVSLFTQELSLENEGLQPLLRYKDDTRKREHTHAYVRARTYTHKYTPTYIDTDVHILTT